MGGASNGMNFLVFLGSVREGRMAVRVGRYLKSFLESRNHEVTILDPKELGLAQVVQPVHFYKNPADAPRALHDLNKQIKDADGFFAVGAEYNSQPAPALFSLMDHFPTSSYSYRPSAIVTYSGGGLGGIRAAMQMRIYLTELTTVPMASMIVIPKVGETLDEEGNVKGEQKALAKSSESCLKQFEWYASLLKEGRERGTPK